MSTRDWPAWDHIDRLESLVYDAIYSERLAPDPSQVPGGTRTLRTDEQANRRPRGRAQQEDKAGPSPGLRFLDGN